MHCRSLLFACSALALAAGSVQAAEWRLVEVSGTVRIAVPGAEAAPARLNQTAPTGSSITTALGGRAALDNGLQHIVVGSNSRMTVAPDAGGFTRVMQDLGAVMFKVDKQKAPHFRVDTPLLAAIVKGTTFTVVVGPQSDSVNVAEGLVEVRSNATDMASDVPAGSSGAVSRDAPQSVQVIGTVTSTSGESAAVTIEPLDYKTVSGGLVDSGGPTALYSEAGAIASNNGSAGASPGAESVGQGALPIEVARNDRQAAASIAAGGNGAGASNPAPSTGLGNNGDGGNSTQTGGAVTTGNGNGNNGNGNGNGGGSTETGGVVTTGNGNGNNGNGNGGGSTDTGGAVTTGNGNGNNGNGNGNGNGGGSTETGGAVTTGNGNGNNGSGNGNGGGLTETGGAVPTGNGNGNSGSGNGNGGGSTETGGAVTTGNGNGNNGNGGAATTSNGNGKDRGPK